MSETEARAAGDAAPDPQPEQHPSAQHRPDEPGEQPSEQPTPQPIEQPGEEPVEEQEPTGSEGRGQADPEPTERQPDWWHRSHPTFAGLVGFFTGVVYIIVVPGGYAALLSLLFGDATAQRLFPLAPAALLVPLALLVPRKTRRFAQFMLVGVFLTVVVVSVTATIVIWILLQTQG